MNTTTREVPRSWVRRGPSFLLFLAIACTEQSHPRKQATDETGAPACVEEAYAECYFQNLRWYDSCGNRGEIKEVCPTDKCNDRTNTCVECEDHVTSACDGDDVVETDACGGVTRASCDEDQTCYAGACVECDSGISASRCSSDGGGVVRLDRCGGVIEETSCGADEACSDSSGHAECVACDSELGERECSGGDVVVSDLCGETTVVDACSSSEACHDASCCDPETYYYCIYDNYTGSYYSYGVVSHNDCYGDGVYTVCDQNENCTNASRSTSPGHCG